MLVAKQRAPEGAHAHVIHVLLVVGQIARHRVNCIGHARLKAVGEIEVQVGIAQILEIVRFGMGKELVNINGVVDRLEVLMEDV